MRNDRRRFSELRMHHIQARHSGRASSFLSRTSPTRLRANSTFKPRSLFPSESLPLLSSARRTCDDTSGCMVACRGGQERGFCVDMLGVGGMCGEEWAGVGFLL